MEGTERAPGRRRVDGRQLAMGQAALERGQHFAPKQRAQDANREEMALAGGPPALAVGREAAGRHDAVDVGMELERAGPRMQHGRDVELGPEPLRIAAQREQGLRGGPQRRQQSRAEHHVPVLVALAGPHTNEHPGAVDVRGGQRAQLADAQAGPIGHHHHRAVLEQAHGGEELRDLTGTQDLRQPLAHPARVRDALHHRRAVQGDPVEKMDRRDVHAVRRPAHAALAHQVIEKRAGLRLPQRRRRSPMIRHEPRGTPQVHALRDGAQAPQPQIDRHPLAQYAHGRAPFRSAHSDIECRRGLERISVGMTRGDRERCFDRGRDAPMTSSPLPRSGFVQTYLSDSR
jgi:hypothetical protein